MSYIWCVDTLQYACKYKMKSLLKSDKGNKQNNFSNIQSFLQNLDHKSLYHNQFNEGYGYEKQSTFFHTKKENKSYQIDFLFLKALNAQRVEIGSYSEWIRFSDHMPLICQVQ